ncbi:MAG: beta-propeller fold lactonase family protein [Candidatus Dormibacteraceae bacterium]
MRSLVSIVCAMVVVAACGRVPGDPTGNGDFKLYEAVSDRSQIAVIDSQSHSVERWLPLGTPSPDWKHLYSVAGSSLTDTDPQTGAVRFSLRLPGSYQLPPATLSGLPGGLSQDGRRLALQSFDRAPERQPTASHFLVVSTSLTPAPVRVDITGFFNFDAISNDGDRLYLIQYLSAISYRVRMYRVSAQQLDPQVIFDKTDPKDSMTGERLSGIPSRDGGFLYSIYVRQNDGPFIHALTLDGSPIAFCIDLPGSGYQASSSGFDWSLAMSADGSRLYAANGATGMVSEVDLGSSLSVGRSVKFDPGKTVAAVLARDLSAKELGAGATVVSLDGKTLVTTSSTGIAFVDARSLQAGSHALTSWTVVGLALSPDGKVLYALGDSGNVAEISMATRQVATTFGSGAGHALALMRVEAA